MKACILLQDCIYFLLNPNFSVFLILTFLRLPIQYFNLRRNLTPLVKNPVNGSYNRIFFPFCHNGICHLNTKSLRVLKCTHCILKHIVL